MTRFLCDELGLEPLEALAVDELDTFEDALRALDRVVRPWQPDERRDEHEGEDPEEGARAKGDVQAVHERKAFEKNPELRIAARDRIEGALIVVFDRARAAGEVRSDPDGIDVMQLLGSMCMSATLTPSRVSGCSS